MKKLLLTFILLFAITSISTAQSFIEEVDNLVRKEFSVTYQGKEISNYASSYIYYQTPKDYTKDQFKKDAHNFNKKHDNVEILKVESVGNALLFIYQIKISGDVSKTNISFIPVANNITVGIDVG